MFETTTPKDISEAVLKFCTEIDPTHTPFYIRPQPDPKAIRRDCFLNVNERIKVHGGSMQLGWIIWESPGMMLEAEFHAIWRSPDGTLVDTTPPTDGEPELLFLVDSKATIDTTAPDGEFRGQHRKPLVDDPLIHEFIRLARKKDAIRERVQEKVGRREIVEIGQVETQMLPIMQKLSLKYQGKVGEPVIQPLSYRPEAIQHNEALESLVAFSDLAGAAIHRQGVKIGRNDPCPCGSGKKYKKCHGG